MIHRTRGKAAKEDKGFLREFPYKNEYKYLGITIDRNLTLRNHLNNLKSKMEKGQKILYMCNKRSLPEWKRKYL